MQKQEFIKAVTEVLHQNDMRKPISIPKHTLFITDDAGNSTQFSVKRQDKAYLYTAEDVSSVIEACLYVIKKNMSEGESLTFMGYGTLGLSFRKTRATKDMNTGETITIPGHYIPKFTPGKKLKTCAKIYEESISDVVEQKKKPFDYNPNAILAALKEQRNIVEDQKSDDFEDDFADLLDEDLADGD